MADCDEIDFKTDDIEDFLNESFMVLDEVEEFRQKMVSYDQNRLNAKNNSQDATDSDVDGVEIEIDTKSTEDIKELVDGEKAEENGSTEGLEDVEVKDEEDNSDLTHPYLCLIECYKLTPEQKTITKMESRSSLEETKFITSSYENYLKKFVKTLREASEISIDLHYTLHSGEHLCFMAVSTRDTDYLLDCKSLKHAILMLTEIFINPKIVKVIYDADKVLSYLQRNFHLFLVNIFDVKRALEVLKSKHTSWNAMLKEKYSYDVEEQQKYIDIQQRPASSETQTFCRVTAHYLIDTYHESKNELLQNKNKSLYDELMKEFRETSKVIFPLIQRCPVDALAAALKNRQMCELFVLKRLFHWRNGIAKKVNKNPDMVLGKQTLMKLATTLYDYSPLIFTINQSPVIHQNVNQIINLITKAKTKFKLNIPSLRQKKQQYIDYLLVKLDELGEKPPYNKRKFESNQSNQRQSEDRRDGISQKSPQPSPNKKPKFENTNSRNCTNKEKFQPKPSPSKSTNVERSNSSYNKKSNVNTNKPTTKRFVSPPRSNKTSSKNSSKFVSPPKQIPSLFASTSTPAFSSESNWKEPLLPPPNQNTNFANNNQFLAPSPVYGSDNRTNNQFMVPVSSQRQVFLNPSGGTNTFVAPPNQQTYMNNPGALASPYSQNLNNMPNTMASSNQFPNMMYSIKDQRGVNSNPADGRRKSRFDIPPSQDYITSYGGHMLPSTNPANSSPANALSAMSLATATALFKQSTCNRPQGNTFPATPTFNTTRNNFGGEMPRDTSKRNVKPVSGSFGNAGDNHYSQLFDNALSDIDQKITTLERKVTQFQAKGSDDYRANSNRRRHM